MDYDVIIVGGGPAGLAAGLQLRQANFRALLLERESFGGPIINVEWINNYPVPGEKVAGAMLASDLVNQALDAGLEMEMGEVTELESYSECKSVRCSDGRAFTAPVVIVAGGLHSKKLGVPGEDRFQGKGMIHCAMCDAGLYRDQVVAVCGGGGAGLIEATYLAKFAAKVIVIEAQPTLTAKPNAQERARANARLDIRCGAKVVEILGADGVTGIKVENTTTGAQEILPVYGVLVHVGFEPTTAYLEGILALDQGGFISVNAEAETDLPGVLAAGDIRSGSPRSVAQALADGRAAAARAQAVLEASAHAN